MTDPVKEQLSACLDGELPEAELDLLLKQVQRDSRLQQSVGQYALIGEVLRTGSCIVPSAGFAARISQAIAVEAPGDQNPLPRPAPSRLASHLIGNRWLRPVGGAAIAAGVAALAVTVLQPQLNGPATGVEQQTAANAQQQPSASASYIVPATTPSQVVPATYLAKYVMAHSEFASPLGRRTVLSGVLSDDESEMSETVDISTPPDAEPQP